MKSTTCSTLLQFDFFSYLIKHSILFLVCSFWSEIFFSFFFVVAITFTQILGVVLTLKFGYIQFSFEMWQPCGQFKCSFRLLNTAIQNLNWVECPNSSIFYFIWQSTNFYPRSFLLLLLIIWYLMHSQNTKRHKINLLILLFDTFSPSQHNPFELISSRISFLRRRKITVAINKLHIDELVSTNSHNNRNLLIQTFDDLSEWEVSYRLRCSQSLI